MDFLTPIIEGEQFVTLRESVKAEGSRVGLFGAHAVHRSLFAAALARDTKSLVLFICETDGDAVVAAEDIRELSLRSAAFPSRDITLLDVEGASHDEELERLSVLGRLADDELDVVCCSVEALCLMTIPKQALLDKTITLCKGTSVRPEELSLKLVSAGYTRCDRVDGRGQFAIRGGIVDIFPASSDRPARLEFFGDEIESISLFDEKTQRRLSRARSVRVTPAREIVLGGESLPQLEKLLSRCKKAAGLEKIVARDIESLRDGITPPSTDRYLFAAYDAPETLFDYMPGAYVFMCEPRSLAKKHSSLIWQHTEELLSLENQGLYTKGLGSFYDPSFSIYLPSRRCVLAEVFTRSIDDKPLTAIVGISANSLPRWGA